jgi:hypothetical protein
MRINCYYEYQETIHGVMKTLQVIFEKLKLKYPEIEFVPIHSHTLRDENYQSCAHQYGPYFLKIENPITKKYILVSYWDKIVNLKQTNWDLENCVEILSSIGHHENDIYYKKQSLVEYTPISYVGATSVGEGIIEDLYSKTKILDNRLYPEKLTFRGHLYLFREHLFHDKRFDVTGTMKSIDENGNVVSVVEDLLNIENYLSELNHNKLNLSLNGAGEICFRDIEILGLGSALFRLKLVTDFHNPLIPDYHYISVDFHDIEEMGNDYEGYCKKVANRVFDKFEKIKKDYDFIDFVAKNGRKWYEENATIEMNSSIATKLIDISKIL